jgi:hypothetical protein
VGARPRAEGRLTAPGDARGKPRKVFLSRSPFLAAKAVKCAGGLRQWATPLPPLRKRRGAFEAWGQDADMGDEMGTRETGCGTLGRMPWGEKLRKRNPLFRARKRGLGGDGREVS